MSMVFPNTYQCNKIDGRVSLLQENATANSPVTMPITKQSIAIIGAGGKIGSAIAKNIAGGNFRLLLFDRNPDRLGLLIEEIKQNHPAADLQSIGCAHDCSWEADIIILAVPHGAEKKITDKIRDVATQKIVISISNSINGNFSKRTTDPGTRAADELQLWLPLSKIVNAFNTTFASNFEQPVIDGKQAGVFLAGDDEEALHTASELLKAAGFNPVLTEGLTVSGTPEQMQLLLNKAHEP